MLKIMAFKGGLQLNVNFEPQRGMAFFTLTAFQHVRHKTGKTLVTTMDSANFKPVDLTLKTTRFPVTALLNKK
jgi:hypothetical protein